MRKLTCPFRIRRCKPVIIAFPFNGDGISQVGGKIFWVTSEQRNSMEEAPGDVVMDHDT